MCLADRNHSLRYRSADLNSNSKENTFAAHGQLRCDQRWAAILCLIARRAGALYHNTTSSPCHKLEIFGTSRAEFIDAVSEMKNGNPIFLLSAGGPLASCHSGFLQQQDSHQ